MLRARGQVTSDRRVRVCVCCFAVLSTTTTTVDRTAKAASRDVLSYKAIAKVTIEILPRRFVVGLEMEDLLCLNARGEDGSKLSRGGLAQSRMHLRLKKAREPKTTKTRARRVVLLFTVVFGGGGGSMYYTGIEEALSKDGCRSTYLATTARPTDRLAPSPRRDPAREDSIRFSSERVSLPGPLACCS